jgi:hypothetical protein
MIEPVCPNASPHGGSWRLHNGESLVRSNELNSKNVIMNRITLNWSAGLRPGPTVIPTRRVGRPALQCGFMALIRDFKS